MLHPDVKNLIISKCSNKISIFPSIIGQFEIMKLVKYVESASPTIL